VAFSTKPVWEPNKHKKGKMRENPKFYKHSVWINVPEHFVYHKTTFTQGQLEAKTFQ